MQKALLALACDLKGIDLRGHKVPTALPGTSHNPASSRVSHLTPYRVKLL
jgi:hypothetical protein